MTNASVVQIPFPRSDPRGRGRGGRRGQTAATHGRVARLAYRREAAPTASGSQEVFVEKKT